MKQILNVYTHEIENDIWSVFSSATCTGSTASNKIHYNECTYLKGYNLCRFNEPKRKKILDSVNQKRSAPADEPGTSKKLPDVYVVNKKKWYLTATTKELETLPFMVLEDDDSEESRLDKHRIIQFKVR